MGCTFRGAGPEDDHGPVGRPTGFGSCSGLIGASRFEAYSYAGYSGRLSIAAIVGPHHADARKMHVLRVPTFPRQKSVLDAFGMCAASTGHRKPGRAPRAVVVPCPFEHIGMCPRTIGISAKGCTVEQGQPKLRCAIVRSGLFKDRQSGFCRQQTLGRVQRYVCRCRNFHPKQCCGQGRSTGSLHLGPATLVAVSVAAKEMRPRSGPLSNQPPPSAPPRLGRSSLSHAKALAADIVKIEPATARTVSVFFMDIAPNKNCVLSGLSRAAAIKGRTRNYRKQ